MKYEVHGEAILKARGYGDHGEAIIGDFILYTLLGIRGTCFAGVISMDNSVCPVNTSLFTAHLLFPVMVGK